MGNRSARIAVVFSTLISLVVVVEMNAQCTWTGAPTVIFTTCLAGIGTTTPNFPLEVVKSGGNVQIAGAAFNATGGAVNFLGRGARGTVGSPQGTLAGDVFMLMGGRGFVGGTGFANFSSSRIQFRAANDFTTASQGGVITFDTIDSADGTLTVTERARVTSDGVLLIGRTTKSSHPVGFNNVKLDIAGDIVISGNINGKYQDVAEWVPVAEQMSVGTVVVVNRSKVNEVVASSHAYDTAVAGVVTGQPGIVLGEPSDSKERIATTGRVKMRVDASAHPIRIGDLLVTSDVTGMAMRSEPIVVGERSFHQPGTIIGKALEPLDRGQGEILVLLSLQ
jgi:hypothetical protein